MNGGNFCLVIFYYFSRLAFARNTSGLCGSSFSLTNPNRPPHPPNVRAQTRRQGIRQLLHQLPPQGESQVLGQAGTVLCRRPGRVRLLRRQQGQPEADYIKINYFLLAPREKISIFAYASISRITHAHRKMALTEEQMKRMMIQRERALEIKRKKNEDRERAATAAAAAAAVQAGAATKEGAKPNDNNIGGNEAPCTEMEEWERGESKLVTKEEAMRKYCLPLGTLAVCSYEEKANPRHKGWTPMRLYNRSEVRKRAHERFNGLDGLVDERRRRERKRFAKDMEETKDLFKTKKSKAP